MSSKNLFHLRSKSSPGIGMILFLAGLTWCLAPDPALCQSTRTERSEPQKVKLPELTVRVDYTPLSDKEAVLDWQRRLPALFKEWFPKLVRLLGDQELKIPGRIDVVFKEMDGVAYSTGSSIVISVQWANKHPDDIGLFVHELVHIVQGYRSPVPGWVTEGVADYVRFFVYEKNGHETCRVRPEKARYTDSYRTTAAFFNWITQTYDQRFVEKLNICCRSGKYSDEFFQKTTEKTLDELWEQFILALKSKEVKR